MNISKYVGSLKSDDDNCSKDTRSRIGKVKKIMLDLVSIWRERDREREGGGEGEIESEIEREGERGEREGERGGDKQTSENDTNAFARDDSSKAGF